MYARRIGRLGTVLTAGALLALAGCGDGDESVESADPAEARTEAAGTASELAGVKRFLSDHTERLAALAAIPVREAAKRLGVSRSTAQRWLAQSRKTLPDAG